MQNNKNKLNNIKYLTIGLILGSFTLSGYADDVKNFLLTKVSYPLIVNGVKYSGDLPILNYSGSTYVPLKATGDLLGAKVSWDNTNKQVVIGDTTTNKVGDSVVSTINVAPTITTIPTVTTVPSVTPIPTIISTPTEEKILTSVDGTTKINIDDCYSFSDEIQRQSRIKNKPYYYKVIWDDNYSFDKFPYIDYNIAGRWIIFKDGDDGKQIVLLDPVPKNVLFLLGGVYISKIYFNENILPLLK